MHKPAVNFFEGALLGNGALGAVVTTRPDAVVVHFGHNSVWDIRLAEHTMADIGTFEEICQRIREVPAGITSLEDVAWYREYRQRIEHNYRQKPYPRPFPCGSLLLGFDRHCAELLEHIVDIATGLCEVRFLVDDEVRRLQAFVQSDADCLWLRMVDASGKPCPSPFDRVRLIPDPETPEDLPAFEMQVTADQSALTFRQVLPASEPIDGEACLSGADDRAFRLSVTLSCPFVDRQATNAPRALKTEFINSFLARGVEARTQWLHELEQGLSIEAPFVACVSLTQGLARVVELDTSHVERPTLREYDSAATTTADAWRQYWQRAAIALDDPLLEQVWYRNQYFLNCAVKPGSTCPGLFANWRLGKIGTAWHGDYHMNYNTQQAFWGVFSTNQVEKHLPYVDLIWRLLPLAQKWARDYYGLRGACFPHVAFPVEMSLLPFRVPWSWQISETPWAVQSLWWHYLYTADRVFLRERAFEPIKQVVLFLVDYLRRPETHGPPWSDDCYHIIPTISPELHGMTPRFERNFDCLVDLTLIRFLFDAFVAACRELDLTGQESSLLATVGEVRDHLPPYPTAMTADGPVFVSLPDENPEIVYNTPNSTATVFPGEEHGLHSPDEWYRLACRTYCHQRNEGGNDLVFLNLQGARLGILDLERFKRQLRYCEMPNGTYADMLLQTGGRYRDEMPFDFMARLGVWFENFALPAVINECLLQSYNGTLRLFPNWPSDRAAAFHDLRAVGGFLVSAAIENGRVYWVRIRSEAGTRLQVLVPWSEGCVATSAAGAWLTTQAVLNLDTAPGETVILLPPDA